MKQILQSLKDGHTRIVEVPIPQLPSGSVLIATDYSLISSGTERMLVEFGKSGWLGKLRQQPEKVQMVLEKLKTDGFQPTLEAVMSKLETPMPLGYCNMGRVVGIGQGVTGFNLGDRVISNGKHAEIVSVPINLCAKIPKEVSDEDAVFTVLGAIALQGIRLAKPTLGETFAVTGLGLVGLMTVQLLRAHGCRVLGIDFDKEKIRLAKDSGAEVVDLSNGEDPISAAEIFSRGRGLDAVIITATTDSNEPIRQAATMCRKRGRIILIGVTGLQLYRDDFYKKELTFQVSASYGPGRYDPSYEEKGHDYPIGYVRWTEQRNFEAVLDMIAEGRLDVAPLVSHRFDIMEAHKAYDLISGGGRHLAIVLKYPGFLSSPASSTIQFKPTSIKSDLKLLDPKRATVSIIGAGNYAASVLVPAFKRAGAYLRIIGSNTGVSSAYLASKYNFDEATTENTHIFSDPNTNSIVIATRHNSHAKYVIEALRNGKNVYVEKPLCLTLDELNIIEKEYKDICNNSKSIPILMVGFNRRFSPHIQKIKELLKGIKGPRTIIATINAGPLAQDHWIKDLEIGGGRIIGEACHFVDLLRCIAGSPITDWSKSTMNGSSADTVTITLKFEDGSMGTIHYFSNGNKAFPKERIEVFAGGNILHLDNFRKLSGYNTKGFKKMNLWRQDKGQANCVHAFVDAVSNNLVAPIPIDELIEISRISIEIAN